MNYGTFKNATYTKYISFSKAVLWHTRQLSLRKEIVDRIVKEGVKLIVFVDSYKKEQWIFKTEKVLASMELKSVGQEDQYYFPIDSAKKVKMKEVPACPYVFDEVRQVYVERDSSVPDVVNKQCDSKQSCQPKVQTSFL